MVKVPCALGRSKLLNWTFAVKGNAQVVLGGQYKQNNKAFGIDTGSSAEFTGIIADTLLVQENASVSSYNALVDNLTVEGGTVNIHTSAGEGNLGVRLEAAKVAAASRWKPPLLSPSRPRLR